jgi:ribosomal protection tetracycline resistance protein
MHRFEKSGYFETASTIIFINKIDRIGADVNRVLNEVKKVLTALAIPLQDLANIASSATSLEYSTDVTSLEPKIKLIINEEFEGTEIQRILIEAIAETDELILEKYLEGEKISTEFLKERINTLIGEGSIYPVLYGSALKGFGITELLDLLLDGTPAIIDYSEEELSGIVFKVKSNKTMGKMAFVKLYSGKIESRDSVYNYTKDISEKVTLIKN